MIWNGKLVNKDNYEMLPGIDQTEHHDLYS